MKFTVSSARIDEHNCPYVSTIQETSTICEAVEILENLQGKPQVGFIVVRNEKGVVQEYLMLHDVAYGNSPKYAALLVPVKDEEEMDEYLHDFHNFPKALPLDS